MLASLRPHFLPTLRLAWPVVLSQVGHVLVGVVDSLVVGRLGTRELAALPVGISVTTVVLMFGIGLSMGITPLVAAANGQGNVPRLRKLLVNGVALSGALGVLLALAGLLMPLLLQYLGQPATVVALAGPWVRLIFFSMLPLMLFQGLRQFVEGLGLTKQAMVLSLVANLLNALLCYVLVFGNWGAPALGMLGTGWATLLARTLMAVMLWAYVLWTPRLAVYRPSLGRWFRLSSKTLRRLLGLGAPIGAQMTFEVGAFSVAALMIGWLGEHALAAHQIAINVASLTYMAASGIAAAATIRVGNLAGIGDRAGSRAAGFTAYGLSLGFMSLMALVLVASRHYLPTLLHQPPAVVAQASTLLLIAALFQVSDGLQVVGLGALRGLEDVKVPSLVALSAYWLVALPLAYLLGIALKLGSAGVWIGLLAGLSIVAIVLLRRFNHLSSS